MSISGLKELIYNMSMTEDQRERAFEREIDKLDALFERVRMPEDEYDRMYDEIYKRHFPEEYAHNQRYKAEKEL